MAGEATALLEARDVGRRRAGGDGWLLRDVRLAIGPGDRLALVGPSGGGKTLLLRALALLDPLDAGAVCWRGRPVHGADVPAFRRRVIYLHQRPALFPGTVEDNLRLPYQLRAYQDSQFDRDRTLRRLAELGREPSFLTQEQRNLSGGEGQLVALLRALQLGPTVLLLDEPTAALDPGTARAVEAMVRRWHDDGAGTRAYVWVSHDDSPSRRAAERQLRVQNGRLEGEVGDDAGLS